MKLKNITVATEKKGYYNVLEQSCKRHNIELVPLGMGEEWTGFTMRFKLWRDYLNTLDDNEIVMINDAYDVVILEDGDTIIKKFKSFNKNIVFGYHDTVVDKLMSSICNEKKYVVCMGNIIGYVKYLKQLIKLIYKYSDLWEKWNNDDQAIVNDILCKELKFLKNNVTGDKNQILFWAGHSNFGSGIPRYPEYSLNIKNNKIYIKNTNITPSILHLVCSMNGNNLLKKLNYKKLPNENKLNSTFKNNQAYNVFKNMLLIHNISIILQIIMISLYIGFFKINYKNFILFLLIFIFIFDYKSAIIPGSIAYFLHMIYQKII